MNKTECPKAYDMLYRFMEEHGVGEVVARGILNFALKRTKFTDADLDRSGLTERLVGILQNGVEIFVDDPSVKTECKTRLDEMVGARPGASRNIRSMARARTISPSRAGVSVDVAINNEDDIVAARNQARSLAESKGFSRGEQIKLATAVSELARNIYKYAGSGTIQIVPTSGDNPGIRITATDKGGGIRNIDEIMKGKYKSKTGLGLGLIGCKRLMDEFNVMSHPNHGTTVTAVKYMC